MKRPMVAILVLLLMQCVVGVALLFMGSNRQMMPDVKQLSLGTIVADVVALLACLWLFRESIYQTPPIRKASFPWWHNVVALFACMLGTLALDLLSELLDLPNTLFEQTIEMCTYPLGIVAIALVAPIAEEVIFRWGIMRHLLRSGQSTGIAILLSALAFGLIHMNPVQVFLATAMGVLLGLLYWKSGSLLIPCILHIVNNSVACLQAYIMGDEIRTFNLVEYVGGAAVAWTLITILSLICISTMYWYASRKDA